MAMEIPLTTTYQIRYRVFSLFNFFRARRFSSKIFKDHATEEREAETL